MVSFSVSVQNDFTQRELEFQGGQKFQETMIYPPQFSGIVFSVKGYTGSIIYKLFALSKKKTLIVLVVDAKNDKGPLGDEMYFEEVLSNTKNVIESQFDSDSEDESEDDFKGGKKAKGGKGINMDGFQGQIAYSKVGKSLYE